MREREGVAWSVIVYVLKCPFTPCRWADQLYSAGTNPTAEHTFNHPYFQVLALSEHTVYSGGYLKIMAAFCSDKDSDSVPGDTQD